MVHRSSRRQSGVLTRLSVLLLWIVVAVTGCGTPRAVWPETAAPDADGSGAVWVTTRPVVNRITRRTVEAVGTLFGYEEVTVSAKVEGRICRVAHDVADRVRPGEVLVEIEPIDYELSARQAERALQVECAKLGLDTVPGPDFDVTRVPQVVQARINLENHRERYDRSRKLSAGQAAAREELADKLTTFRVAQAEYDNQFALARAGLATVLMRSEALAIARQHLTETTLRVPIPTRVPPRCESVAYAITARAVAEGSFVRPGAEVMRLVIENPLKLRLLVPERHAPVVKLGQDVDVFTVDSDRPFAGGVTRINPAVDPANRTFEVEVLVPNLHGHLKPGGFAKSLIRTRVESTATTVGLDSLTHFAGVTKLFLIEHGRAREVVVVAGLQGPDWVEITSPELPADADVVTSGFAALYDGAAVRVRPTRDAAGPPGAGGKSGAGSNPGAAP